MFLLTVIVEIPVGIAEVVIDHESEEVSKPVISTKNGVQKEPRQNIYRLHLSMIAPFEQPKRAIPGNEPVGLMDWIHPQLGLSVQFNWFLGLEYQFSYLFRNAYAENTPKLDSYGLMNRLSLVTHLPIHPVTFQFVVGMARTDFIDQYEETSLNFGKVFTLSAGIRILYEINKSYELSLELTELLDAHNYQTYRSRDNESRSYDDQGYPMSFIGLGLQYRL